MAEDTVEMMRFCVSFHCRQNRVVRLEAFKTCNKSLRTMRARKEGRDPRQEGHMSKGGAEVMMMMSPTVQQGFWRVTLAVASHT